VEAGDAIAMYNLGCNYAQGVHGFVQDHDKALELWYKAGELGHAESYYNIGCAYDNGRSLEVDKKKAKQYYELAAIKGSVMARFVLGNMEERGGSMDRAIKHYMIAIRGGGKDFPFWFRVRYDSKDDPLQAVGWLYLDGHATKDDYDKALEADQAYLDEIKSDQRDKAVSVDYDYKYKYY